MSEQPGHPAPGESDPQTDRGGAGGGAEGAGGQESPRIRDFGGDASVSASQEGSASKYITAPKDRWAHRRGEPRTFAAAWILFLFGATVVSVGAVGALGLLSADVYRPAARVMVEITAVGICVLWPMVRLSQEAPKKPLRAMALDVLVMVGPLQAVVWPQALSWMAGWSAEVVLCLSLFMSGWAVLIGGLLAVYFVRVQRAGRGLARWAVMALLMLLVLVGPLVAALSGPGRARAIDPAMAPARVEWLMTSPLTGVYEITRDRSWTGQHAVVDGRHWAGSVLAWGAGGFAWLVAGAMSARLRRRGAGPGEGVNGGGVATGAGVA